MGNSKLCTANPVSLQLLHDRANLRRRTGNHRLFRAVQRSKGDRVAGSFKCGGDRSFIGRNSEHLAAVRQALHQSAACGDQPQTVFETEHSRRTSRRVFADAVSENGCRFDTPGLPKLPQ